MRSCIGIIVSLLLGLAPVGMSCADTAELELRDLSLQELLAVEVVTPTAQAQLAAESPAVVSVLTAAELRDLGVATLAEALSYLPGVVVSESYWGYTTVNIRGSLQVHYNHRILLMINGHQTREVVNGSAHLEMVPLDAIDRIELVRGPGSALYGTNAFAGVINIITRRGADPASRGVRLGAGSFSTIEAGVTWGWHEDGIDLLVAATAHNDSGYPLHILQDERGQSGHLDYENDVSNGLLVLDLGELTISAAGFRQSRQKIGIVPVLDHHGLSRFRGGFLDLEWRREVQDNLALSARVRWDTMNRDHSKLGSFPFDGFEGHDSADVELSSSGSLLGTELNLSWVASDRASILGGVVFEHRRSEPYLFRFVDDGSIHPFSPFQHTASARDLAVYGQGLLTLGDSTDLVLGFRYIESRRAGSTFLPRLGLVHRLSPDLFVKLLYAEAYRTPDFFETDVETYDVLWGDPELGPERTENLDLALDATLHQRYNLQLSAFYQRSYDLIQRAPTTDPGAQGPSSWVFANLGNEDVWGLEAALRAEAGPRLGIVANYSFRQGRDRRTHDELQYIAEQSANLILTYRLAPSLKLVPGLQYVGQRGAVDAYTLLRAVLTWQVRPDLELSLIGRNLGDEHYAYPEYIRRNIDSIPAGPQRSFLVRACWRPGLPPS